MPVVDLAKQSAIDAGNDSIVIRQLIQDIPGGRTLDASAITAETINAGHIIIEETATGTLKPMPVSGTSYGSLPASHTYKGVLVASILTEKPFASILVRGSVNEVASPYAVPSAAKTALPLITFTQD